MYSVIYADIKCAKKRGHTDGLTVQGTRVQYAILYMYMELKTIIIITKINTKLA